MHLLDAVSHICTFTTLQAISYVIMHFKCFIEAFFVLDIYGYFGVLLTWLLLFTTLLCAQLTQAVIGQMSFLQCLGLFFVIMLPALDLHLTFFGFRFLLGASLERV